MQRNMAQEKSSEARRRNLERHMKELQSRTKVVLRHLPPSISESVLLEYIHSKYPGYYTWFSFRPGKASLKRQVFSRAYINFKRPEDVYDFYEDFHGHVFLNERGTQYRLTVEYAPYQRIPKPRSKKDIREGTITKDPDYLEFLEMLGRPMEYLPSAELQLERREAEKAAALVASGGRESIIVTPLMEFVRQRRAAKATPQRSVSSKLAGRSGGMIVVSSNLASHKRGLERSRSGPLMYAPDNSLSTGLPLQKDSKEVPVREHVTGQRREEQQQRREREVFTDRRKKEITEAKEKKIVHEHALSASKESPRVLHLDTAKDGSKIAVSRKDSLYAMLDGDLTADEVNTVDVDPLSSYFAITGKAPMTMPVFNEGVLGDVAKDSSKRDVAKKKQLVVIKEKPNKDLEVGPISPGQIALSGYNRHRTLVSPRVISNSMQSQHASSSHYAASDEGTAVGAVSKIVQRRELPGRSSSRGTLLPREQQSPSQQGMCSFFKTLSESQVQPQQGSLQADKGGKRPPRPQNVRFLSKEHSPTPASSLEFDVDVVSSNLSGAAVVTEEISTAPLTESFPSTTDRQDSRRVRNKDRPDRPVWTPRRRFDAVQSLDPASSGLSATSTPVAPFSSSDPSDLQGGGESSSRLEKPEKVPIKLAAKAVSVLGLNIVENKVTELPPGAGHSDARKSQPASGSLVCYAPASGKARYVEFGGNKCARGTRAIPANVLSIQDHMVRNQGDQSGDFSLPVVRENGESAVSSTAEKEKRKQDNTPPWNELTGSSHRSGDRRRERNAQHAARDSDGGVAPPELSKTTKRSGSLVLGTNEKQVWVAVQKSGPGT